MLRLFQEIKNNMHQKTRTTDVNQRRPRRCRTRGGGGGQGRAETLGPSHPKAPPFAWPKKIPLSMIKRIVFTIVFSAGFDPEFWSGFGESLCLLFAVFHMVFV